MQVTPFTVPLILVCVITLALAWVGWRQRPGVGILPFSLLMGTLCFWAFSDLLIVTVTHPTAKLTISHMQYLGIGLGGAAWLWFTLEYTRGQYLRQPGWLLFLLFEPLLAVVAASTNDLHGLFYPTVSIGQVGGLEATFGPLFWLHNLYTYSLTVIGVALLLRTFITRPDTAIRAQIAAILTGAVIPVVVNALTLFGVVDVPALVITPLAFPLTGLCVAWALFRHRLLEVTPVAEDTITQGLPDAIIVTDRHNRIADLNATACELLNGSRAQLLSTDARHALPVWLPTPTAARQEDVTAPDDTIYAVRVTPLHDARGELRGYVMSVRDITSIKMVEAQLRNQYEQMRKAREQAEEASRLKSEFLATVSHELRTPLNVIMGYAEMMLSGIGGDLSEQHTHWMERSFHNADNLMVLINNLLDISKIEAQEFELIEQTFHLKTWLEDVTLDMRRLARNKGLAFEAVLDDTLPRAVTGDPLRLRQIAINLIGNAIKFTDEGHVHVFVRRAAEDKMDIIVADTGIGLTEEQLTYVFDEFRQVNAKSRKGTGLGLAIVRKLSRVMGGEAYAESTYGQGSTFTVTLPLDLSGRVYIE